MNAVDTPSARLKALREDRLGLSQRELAAQLGVSGPLVAQAETGKINVSRKLLHALADRFNVNPAWLIEGREPMIFDRPAVLEGRSILVEQVDTARPGHGDLVIEGKDYAYIRRMELSVSAGSGIEPPPADQAEGIVLPMDWFRRRGVNSDLCVFVSVRGDSMTPGIPDGALVMVDCFAKTVEKAGIFAFVQDGQVFVKRLVPSGTGRDGRPTALMLLSDNPAYEPRAVAGAAMNDIRIVGRVRLVLASL